MSRLSHRNMNKPRHPVAEPVRKECPVCGQLTNVEGLKKEDGGIGQKLARHYKPSTQDVCLNKELTVK